MCWVKRDLLWEGASDDLRRELAERRWWALGGKTIESGARVEASPQSRWRSAFPRQQGLFQPPLLSYFQARPLQPFHSPLRRPDLRCLFHLWLWLQQSDVFTAAMIGYSRPIYAPLYLLIGVLCVQYVEQLTTLEQWTYHRRLTKTPVDGYLCKVLW